MTTKCKHINFQTSFPQKLQFHEKKWISIVHCSKRSEEIWDAYYVSNLASTGNEA